MGEIRLEEDTDFAAHEILCDGRVFNIFAVVITQMRADVLRRDVEAADLESLVITEMAGIEVDLGEFRDIGIFRVETPGAGLVELHAAILQGAEPAGILGVSGCCVRSLEVVSRKDQILCNRAAEAERIDAGTFAAARGLELIVMQLIEGAVKIRGFAGRIGEFGCSEIEGFAAVEAGQCAAGYAGCGECRAQLVAECEFAAADRIVHHDAAVLTEIIDAAKLRMEFAVRAICKHRGKVEIVRVVGLILVEVDDRVGLRDNLPILVDLGLGDEVEPGAIDRAAR